MIWLMEILNIQQEEQLLIDFLRDEASNIAKNPKYDGYQRCLASMVYKFVDKKSASLAGKSTEGGGVTTLAKKSTIKNQITQNQQLVEELQRPIFRKFKKRTVYSSFKDNICGADLADMQLMASLTKESDFYYV